MKPENAIEVHNVKKDFKIYSDKGKWLKDRVVTKGRNKYELRHVLKGISFDVKKGEAIGLIGKNGCGKSTTLKLLSKIIRPNEGTIGIEGRVSSLLELGAGFHPDLSGRKNIYMNAAIFGLTKKEIDDRLDDIIRFSELEEFIENPIRTYSSGMYMRLAFSVAINVDADILLIDEILAVGDISFQTKCFEKLKEIKAAGTTIIIVSHSLDQIEKICNRSIWIEDGLIREEGIPHDVHGHYLYEMERKRLEKLESEYYAGAKAEEEIQQSESEQAQIEQAQAKPSEAEQNEIELGTVEQNQEKLMEEVQTEISFSEILKQKREGLSQNLLKIANKKAVRGGNKKVQFSEVYITNDSLKETLVFETGQQMLIHIFYTCKQEKLKGTFYFDIYNDNGILCYSTNTFYEQLKILDMSREGYINIALKNLNLLPGKYSLGSGVYDEDVVRYDCIDNCVEFRMLSTKGDLGIFRLDNEWEIVTEETVNG